MSAASTKNADEIIAILKMQHSFLEFVDGYTVSDYDRFSQNRRNKDVFERFTSTFIRIYNLIKQSRDTGLADEPNIQVTNTPEFFNERLESETCCHDKNVDLMKFTTLSRPDDNNLPLSMSTPFAKFRVFPSEGDNTCLVHSLLNSFSETYRQINNLVYRSLVGKLFREYVLKGLYVEGTEDYREVVNMREYLADTHLQKAADYFQFNALIFDANAAEGFHIRPIFSGGWLPKTMDNDFPWIMMFYSENNHYDSIYKVLNNGSITFILTKEELRSTVDPQKLVEMEQYMQRMLGIYTAPLPDPSISRVLQNLTAFVHSVPVASSNPFAPSAPPLPASSLPASSLPIVLQQITKLAEGSKGGNKDAGKGKNARTISVVGPSMGGASFDADRIVDSVLAHLESILEQIDWTNLFSESNQNPLPPSVPGTIVIPAPPSRATALSKPAIVSNAPSSSNVVEISRTTIDTTDQGVQTVSNSPSTMVFV